MKSLLIIFFITIPLLAITPNPNGVHGVSWGSSPATVSSSATPAVTNWQSVPATNFLPQLNVTAFTSNTDIAGYKAKTTYYFYNNQLFQATIKFNFDDLKSYDFNYNVFISVDKYYREIRKRTKVFVENIYTLLSDKYGKKQPVFLPLDPREVLVDTDNYLMQERWNLRYHPSEYYKRIIGRAYARWKYPNTEINFSINIYAADKVFDYILSFGSTKMRRVIESDIKSKKSSGL